MIEIYFNIISYSVIDRLNISILRLLKYVRELYTIRNGLMRIFISYISKV